MADETRGAVRIREALRDAASGLVEREHLLELVMLAAVAGEHLLVVGPPGTAKSEAVRRAAGCLQARYFEYLLGRFTEPSELFGPIDLDKLRSGRMETQTHEMLPEAEVAFLDEVFLGSTAILNTLLGLLNERTFRRGHTHRDVPLRVCVGASNDLPEEPALAAFADRFLLHAFVHPVPDHRLEDLLEAHDRVTGRAARRASIDDLDHVTRAAAAVDLSRVRPLLAEAVRSLRAAGVQLSDRRIVKLQRLVAAACALDGRSIADGGDLWPVINAMPGEADQQTARTVLDTHLRGSRNATLGEAALVASQSLEARTQKLLDTAEVLFANAPDAGDTVAHATWRRRLESVGREVDVAFAPDARPAALSELRSRVAALSTPRVS